MKKISIVFVLNLIATLSFSQDSEATEIVRKSDEKFRGENRYSEITMEIIRPSWTREISMKSWSKGNDFLMMLITGPARDKGTTFLKREKEIWNYLPTVDRLIKLPPSMMSQSWMGSDFSNNDLVRESSIITDYNHFMEGSETMEGLTAWKIRMESKPDAPVVWDKVLVWIDQVSYNQLRIEYYSDDGELTDTIIFSDIKEIGGKEIPNRMEMIPADEEGHKTVLTYQSMDFNPNLEDSFFSKQNMTRIR